MKVKDRGRAKFRPTSDYSSMEVKSILLEKIQFEQEFVRENSSENNVHEIIYNPEKLNVISLFSGCGGLDLGVELAGLDTVKGRKNTNLLLDSKEKYKAFRNQSLFHTVYSLDIFKEANETYRINFPTHVLQEESDIRMIKFFPKADVILGGFPCPGFSSAGPRLIDDDRNFLYIHFIRSLLQTQPAFFIAENVKGMLTLANGEVAKQIFQDFSSVGYNITYKLVNARDYGVPQLRERVFIIGIRNDLDHKFQFPQKTHGTEEGLKPFVTLRDAIGDLEADPGDWFEGDFSSIYLSRNRKKDWTDQSFTIQASGRQAPLHPSGPPMEKTDTDKWILPGRPEYHRRLSVKEISRIQTFPDWFEFSSGNQHISKNGRLNKVYKQIGNAVPVELARQIALPLAQWSMVNFEKIKASRPEHQQLELFV
ncbi:DNA cytosine methyltransferase [Shouchella clausii]|uniref:DNA cytosine methyltransferase n=1 Tax=Shouchella clausii TaxID=79880 RepID=UPI000BA74AB8|nr:DNA cytosine methyltransferase [Shouchella clausii]PAE96832.1 DNA (cytosine-5-)-methyltransferase [Shouchella clausii]PAF09633.1 DNA (cytosine-5-)-methyltransferase [Shouchella clausii]